MDSTSDKILAAAKKVFQEKGMAGARMQDIADEAGINKALLHYYFKNKEQLFFRIFSEALNQFFPKIIENIQSEKPLFEKISTFCSAYIEMMLKNPYLPLFIVNEINNHPDRMREIFWQGRENLFLGFTAQVEAEYSAGIIKQVSPANLFLNMLSMCVFPFVAKPMWLIASGMDELQFRFFMEQRKTEVPRFIIESIKK